MMMYVEDDAAFETLGEARMMPQLVGWLRRSRWVRDDSILVRELPVNGRRADLATLTRSGMASAFELKLGGFSRALEQASYNRHAFDRSWLVLGGTPRASNLDEAQRFGIGVIVVGTATRILVRPGPASFDIRLRARTVARMRSEG